MAYFSDKKVRYLIENVGTDFTPGGDFYFDISAELPKQDVTQSDTSHACACAARTHTNTHAPLEAPLEAARESEPGGEGARLVVA